MEANHELPEIQIQLAAAWDRAREIIKSENDLINQRLSWLFAAQAFLFAGLLVGVQTSIDPETAHHGLVMFFLLPVIFVGLISAMAATRMVRDANEQRLFAARFWAQRVQVLLDVPRESKGESADESIEKRLLQHGFPGRIQGNDLGTNEFGLLQHIPGAHRFTRDHTFPQVLSYAWVAIFFLWFLLFIRM